MTVRILLVDDHAVVRDGLAAVFARLDGFEVVGEAATGQQAIEQVRALRPDVVLMDVRMPDLDGIAATRQLRTVAPECAVLMLTMFDDDATVFGAMRAGARGYLLKDAGHEDVASAARAVVHGQAVFGPGIAARMLAFFAQVPEVDYPFPQLAPREREVLELLASGRRTSEIAASLFLSPKTVSNQLTAIFTKLGVADRTGAVVRARESGLGTSP
ncbi:MAG: response regulator transcription factor [Actinomycetota bacterium]|nr:response regulator transcription factor [Actinomycetota bacterium]